MIFRTVILRLGPVLNTLTPMGTHTNLLIKHRYKNYISLKTKNKISPCVKIYYYIACGNFK